MPLADSVAMSGTFGITPQADRHDAPSYATDLHATGRLAAVHRYSAINAARDPAFDRIVSLAADLLGVPMAMISFADEHAQHVLAAIGLQPDDHGPARALCHETVRRRGPHLVLDPQAKTGSGIVFYAAVPLMTQDGFALGALSVLDRMPRPDVSKRDLRRLEDLAALVMDLLERKRAQDDQNRDKAEIALMRDIHAVLTERLSFDATLDQILHRTLHALDAYACRVWERRGAEPFVRLVSRVCVDPIEPGHHEDAAGAYVDLCDLATAELFEPGKATMWRFTNPADQHHPRLGPAVSAGIGSLIGCSLTVSDRRFGIVLTFKGSHSGLADVAALLGRVGLAMRPILQRKLGDEQAALLSSALETTNDAVIIAEITQGQAHYHRIIYVNAAFTEQTGYLPQDVAGQPLAILNVPGADQNEIDRIKLAMQRGQEVRTLLQRRRRDGSAFWAETTLVPLLNAEGVATHRVGIMRDMTQQRAEAEELRARERRLLATTQQLETLTAQLIHTQEIAKLGTWRRLIGSDLIAWSDSVYPMFGETKGSFVPTVASIIAKIHPDDRDVLTSRLLRAGQAAVTYTITYRTVAPDGVVRTVTSDCRCECDEDGSVIAVSGIVQDITEKQHSQAMLLEAEKLRALGQLTGGIAHDFNNLLTVVSVNLEMMGDILGPNDPAEDLRAMALRAADHGAQLTSNLLAFARRQPLQPEACQINTLLAGLKGMAARSIGERHPISLHLAPTLPPCQLDRSRFESAILNLLVNSRDAMPDGGAIAVATSLQTIRANGPPTAHQLQDGDYVRVSVSDTGTGIEPALLERVFEPFFTTKPVGKGTGLGLSTVIGFVRQSGGDVDITSVSAVGTCVSLYLPAMVMPDVSAPAHRTPDKLASFPAD